MTSPADTASASAEMMRLITSLFIPKALAVAAELNLAEQLAQGPLGVAELAQKVDAHAPSLYRLLRALASVGVFRELEHGLFANTSLSETLRPDTPGSLRSMTLFLCGDVHWKAWGELGHSVRTGQSGFERICGKKPFQYMNADPEFAGIFNDAMTRFTEKEVAAIHARLDVSGVTTLVDVGGGQGAFLVSCLAKHPEQRGILFEIPEVIPGAREYVRSSGIGNRCEVVGGDFFQSVPAADGYMLKYILHDWSDEDALRILRTIQRASTKGAKLFIMDTVVKPSNVPDFAKLLDVQVLTFYGGGRERTLPEFSDLLDGAGFRLVRSTQTDSVVSIVEAERR